MNVEDVDIGMIVYPIAQMDDLATIITLPDEDGIVTISWHVGGGKVQSRYHVSDLVRFSSTFKDELVANYQSQIDEATSLFEAAFTKLEDAKDSARSQGLYIFSENFNLSKLESVIEAHGWSASSLRC